MLWSAAVTLRQLYRHLTIQCNAGVSVVGVLRLEKCRKCVTYHIAIISHYSEGLMRELIWTDQFLKLRKERRLIKLANGPSTVTQQNLFNRAKISHHKLAVLGVQGCKFSFVRGTMLFFQMCSLSLNGPYCTNRLRELAAFSIFHAFKIKSNVSI